MTKVKMVKLYAGAITPSRAHVGDAGYDLYACDCEQASESGNVYIPSHLARSFGTGIALEIPDGSVGLVFGRSGLGIKHGIKPRNCVGVIDSGYRGEIKVSLYNDNDRGKNIMLGSRVAQLVIVPYMQYELEEVFTLEESERGEDGFGSSGK